MQNTCRSGYTRIEPEAGGAACRIGPNDILNPQGVRLFRDNRRCDGRYRISVRTQRADSAQRRNMERERRRSGGIWRESRMTCDINEQNKTQTGGKQQNKTQTGGKQQNKTQTGGKQQNKTNKAPFWHGFCIQESGIISRVMDKASLSEIASTTHTLGGTSPST